MFRLTYTGNGSQRDFLAPFNYIRKSHVTARVNGVLVPFTWLNDFTVRLNTAPANGAAIVVERQAPVDAPIHVFNGNTVITAKSLTENFNQTLQNTERAQFADTADLATRAIRSDTSALADVATNALAADTALKADRLDPGRTINGVLFDGTQNIIITDVETAEVAAEAVRAFQADRLSPGATINGVNFTGSAPITISAAPSNSVWKTIFVGPGGNNGSSGRNEDRAVASIERALEILDAQGDKTNWTIKLLGGVATAGELPIPDYTTVVGANFQRQCTITPTGGNEVRNVFLCGNRVHIVNLKFNGWRHDNLTNPSKGFAMAFRPGAIILPGGVPYGQNCVVGAAATSVPTPLPNDFANANPAQPFGMGCAIADSSVLSGFSVFPNIMTWGFTPNSANGIGYLVKNRAHINCVNAIGVGCRVHFMAQSGGNMVLSACSSQFGDYALWSEGSTFQVVPLKVPAEQVVRETGGQSAINGAKAAVQANLAAYIAGLGIWSAPKQAQCPADIGFMMDAIGLCLEWGTQQPWINLIDGLFTFTGESSLLYTDLPSYKLVWNRIRDRILAETSFSAGADIFITALFDRLTATFDNYFYESGTGPAPSPINPVRKRLRSLITAIGHQMTAQLTGTQFFRVPPQGTPRSMRKAIVRRNGGKINFSGQDDRGNALFVGGLEINARSGELGGPPFDSAVFNRAVETAIASSF